MMFICTYLHSRIISRLVVKVLVFRRRVITRHGFGETRCDSKSCVLAAPDRRQHKPSGRLTKGQSNFTFFFGL